MRSVMILGLLPVAAALSGAPSHAGTADFTGTISAFVGRGFGVPTSPVTISGSATGVAFGSSGSAFTVPSAVFVDGRTTPAGFTPNAAPNTIYTIRTVTNTSNSSGAFAGTADVGPFSGTLILHSGVWLELGIVPHPTVFLSLFIPLNAGSPGSSSEMAAILAVAWTATAIGQDWTTGTVTFGDQTASAPVGTVPTSGTVAGTNNLTASGGQITLVTPVFIRLRGAINENRAGYYELTLSFMNKVPEPGVLLLFGAAAVLTARAGSRRRRR